MPLPCNVFSIIIYHPWEKVKEKSRDSATLLKKNKIAHPFERVIFIRDVSDNPWEYQVATKKSYTLLHFFVDKQDSTCYNVYVSLCAWVSCLRENETHDSSRQAIVMGFALDLCW